MYVLTRGRMKFEVYDRIYFENMLLFFYNKIKK